MHALPLGQRLRSDVVLELALLCVFFQNYITLWRPERDRQRHMLGDLKLEVL